MPDGLFLEARKFIVKSYMKSNINFMRLEPVSLEQRVFIDGAKDFKIAFRCLRASVWQPLHS